MSIIGIKIDTNSNRIAFKLRHAWWNFFRIIYIEPFPVMLKLISSQEFRLFKIKDNPFISIMLQVSKYYQNII